jgi:hypothetical protein
VARRITAIYSNNSPADTSWTGLDLAEALHTQLKGPVGLLVLSKLRKYYEPNQTQGVILLDNDRLEEDYLTDYA